MAQRGMLARKLKKDLTDFREGGPILKFDIGGPAKKLRQKYPHINPYSLGRKDASNLVFAKNEKVKTSQGECKVYDINRMFFDKFEDNSRTFNLSPEISGKRHELIGNPKFSEINEREAKRNSLKAIAMAATARFRFEIVEFEGFDRIDGPRKFYAHTYTPRSKKPFHGYPFAMVLPGLDTVAGMYDPVARLLVKNGYKVMVVSRPLDMLLDIMLQGLPLAFYAGVHAGGMKDIDQNSPKNLVVGFSEGSARGPALQSISRVQHRLGLGVGMPLLPNGAFFSGPYFMSQMFRNLNKLEQEQKQMPFVLKQVLEETRQLGITLETGHDHAFWWSVSPRLFVPMLEKKLKNTAWNETKLFLAGGKADPVVPFNQVTRFWADATILGVDAGKIFAVEGPGIHPLPEGRGEMSKSAYSSQVRSDIVKMFSGFLQFIGKLK